MGCKNILCEIAPETMRLRDVGERELIHRICRHPAAGSDVITGPGDDCAVVRPAGAGDWDWLLKSDPVIEGVHFLPADDPASIGHKALGRVFSDIAAMGGAPCWINVNIAAPPDTIVARIEDIYAGIRDLARRHHADITGGDISAAPQISVNVFAVGRVPRGRAVLRSGAHPGDIVCVTGKLGGSRAGRHLAFEPRLPEGRWLQAGGWATAMIDISDGLAADLHHLTDASNTGAEIDAQKIPVSAAAQHGLMTRTPLDHALFDGEDFELLFTVPAARLPDMQKAWTCASQTRCTVIGEITAPDAGITIRRPDGAIIPLTNHGHEHFGNDNT